MWQEHFLIWLEHFLIWQEHFCKISDNIYAIQWEKEDDELTSVAIGMVSGEGEVVPFVGSMTCEGHVEEWLTGLMEECAMTLRERCAAPVRARVQRCEAMRALVRRPLLLGPVACPHPLQDARVHQRVRGVADGEMAL